MQWVRRQNSIFKHHTAITHDNDFILIYLNKQPASPSKRVYCLLACFIWISAKRRQRQRPKSLKWLDGEKSTERI
mgnify:CR=1 FL=1